MPRSSLGSAVTQQLRCAALVYLRGGAELLNELQREGMGSDGALRRCCFLKLARITNPSFNSTKVNLILVCLEKSGNH